MHLDENMNLVLPIREDDKGNPLAWAFHAPISREVFIANFRILSIAKSELFAHGTSHAFGNGPTIAALILKEESKRDADEKGISDTAPAFLSEIKRLTTIIAPSGDGFIPSPVASALSSGSIEEEEWEDTENMLVFFTLIFALAKRSKWPLIKKGAATMLKGSLGSLSCMEFIASLKTSTPGEVLSEGVLLVRL